MIRVRLVEGFPGYAASESVSCYLDVIPLAHSTIHPIMYGHGVWIVFRATGAANR